MISDGTNLKRNVTASSFSDDVSVSRVNWKFQRSGQDIVGWKNPDDMHSNNKKAVQVVNVSGADLDSDEADAKALLGPDPYPLSRLSTGIDSLISRAGKRSPLLKVAAIAPSPALQHVQYPIEDLRVNIMSCRIASSSRKLRSKQKVENNVIRSEFLVDDATSISSRIASISQISNFVNQLEKTGIGSQQKSTTHQCKRLRCETLSRDQFYSRFIKAEKYIDDIWNLLAERARSTSKRAYEEFCENNEPLPSFWSLLAYAHLEPISKLTFFWQKQRHANIIPCVEYNAENMNCSHKKGFDLSHFCLCCGSLNHGATTCRVLNLLEKLLNHYAKKCGMSRRSFDTAIGLSGDPPTYVVMHKSSVDEVLKHSHLIDSHDDTGSPQSEAQKESKSHFSCNKVGIHTAHREAMVSDSSAHNKILTDKFDIQESSHGIIRSTAKQQYALKKNKSKAGDRARARANSSDVSFTAYLVLLVLLIAVYFYTRVQDFETAQEILYM